MTEQSKIKPKNLNDYLDLIRVRLPMYIGSNSLHILASHISGFEAAEWVYGPDSNLNIGFNHFHDFVANHYGLGSSSEGWPTIILNHSGNDDEKAVTEFFRLFDLFKKTNKS